VPLPPELASADRRLVAVARDLHLLGALSWPQHVVEEFLESYRRGSPTLPKVERPEKTPKAILHELGRLAGLSRTDPAGAYLAATAESYLLGCRIVSGAGTAAGFSASCQLFGTPSAKLPGSDVTQRQAAEQLLEVTAPLVEATRTLDDDDEPLSAEEVAEAMREQFGAFFGEAAPEVVLDPGLAAKAAASARRVRLRAGTRFSEDVVRQLVEHEGFVHSATALNGRDQPELTALSLSAPRTTATQEGLATLAELVSGAMDLARLRRVALRVVAIDLAIEGADFLDVFRFFLEHGQSVAESAQSAARVFRGGDVRGRHVFTKDAVYLRGLLAVHTFLRRAIADARPELVPRLFVGRLTLGDALNLAPRFADGTIAPARFVPRWASNLRALAAYLSFSALLNRIDLTRVDLVALWGSA
jgi:uncharacterized protein (TIGR02421 family)